MKASTQNDVKVLFKVDVFCITVFSFSNKGYRGKCGIILRRRISFNWKKKKRYGTFRDKNRMPYGEMYDEMVCEIGQLVWSIAERRKKTNIAYRFLRAKWSWRRKKWSLHKFSSTAEAKSTLFKTKTFANRKNNKQIIVFSSTESSNNS